ncbi:MAG: class I SAM-dependent methyltransferase [Aphanocapsa sp. GSE-SYN-MK-11-07L]|jgi:O-methyltransferase involved in polyketide biosynthesis|nr:class I SAM-dependent methyltransferase [Aphanocapsa sp. GSE-SYN-MK-11-07L]
MIQPAANPFDKISPTALMVAHARQFTDIPYTQALATLVDARSAFDQLLSQSSALPLDMAVMIEGRYKAINQAMAEFAPTQILELASGLLPRGMVMTQDPNLIFVESDLPIMLSRKQKLVQQLVGDRPNLHFAVIDVTAQPSQFPIDAYWQPDQPIAILCEGLLMYLDQTEKQRVFANVRELLQIYGGVWITSDLVDLESLHRRREISPALRQVGAMIARISDRSKTECYFDTFEQVQQFAHQQGFQIQHQSMLNIMPQLTCLQPLGINPKIAEALLADSFVFTLRLR